MGVPLINAIYESDPLVGLYTLPLLIWHPMQLLVGSSLAPRLQAFVKSEQERLGIVDEEVQEEAPIGIVDEEVQEEAPSSAPDPKGESDEELGLVESNKEIETDANGTVYGAEKGKDELSNESN